ncbi:hypothetical protein LJR290_007477 [Variovorax sp. LjRoot290]|uniref:hypothetical protein n=1 Tax=Variovorax sp. LjRoot290 TaxID=3342316 RepID=UPI003ECDC4B8
MGFRAYSRIDAILRPGTTPDEVASACRRFLDWRGLELLLDDSDLYETGVAYDPSTECFILQITCECPHGFAEDMFEPLVNAIGELAAHPFVATLVNESTSNEDSREFEVVAGPSDQLGEFRVRRARCAIEEQLRYIDFPPGSTGDTIADLATRECMSIATFAPNQNAADSSAVTRVAVDLTGLNLDAESRDRIARLATALAREIAGDELLLKARPGAGAADWVLARTTGIATKLGARNALIADEANGGQNARDPNACDYNLAFSETINEVIAIEREALARVQAEAPVEPEAPAAPRAF